MAVQMPMRRPFGVLDESRLQGLASAKNRQNAIIASEKPSFSKTTFSSPVKRCHDLFEDDLDTENIAPTTPFSPQKRSKATDSSTPLKPSRFVLADAASLGRQAPSSAPAPRVPGLLSPVGQKRKLSVTSPQAGSISSSRGSPKHKRVGLLSKKSRASGSPFRRIDPPSFGKTSSQSRALPFSIDAALSGTISSYTPKNSTSASRDVPSSTEKPMPKDWFFAIYEDSPEEEAANIMAHNTGVLDISSDDDCMTKRRNEERERGKENIPPPDHEAAAPATATRNNARAEPLSIYTDPKIIKSTLLSVLDSEAKTTPDTVDPMIDVLAERSPLGDLRTADYYPEGLDGSSIQVFTETSKSESTAAQAGATENGVTEAEQKATQPVGSPVLSTEKQVEIQVPSVEETATSEVKEVAVFDEINASATMTTVQPESAEQTVAS